MSLLFTINFRREAYLREVANRRRRIVTLALWVAYYGALVVVFGLYGLNGATLARRAAMLERQTAQIHRANASQVATALRPQELALVERYATSTRRWRDRLARIGQLVPADARVTGLAVNPQNLTDPAAQNALVVSGSMKGAGSGDKIQGVMKIVSALRSDSTFRSSYKNIKLATTRMSEEGTVDFVIECR